MLFHYIAAMDAAAAGLDAKNQGSGSGLRGEFQKRLALSDADTAALKASAAACNLQLSNEDSKAQGVITAAKAALPVVAGQPPVLPTATIANLSQLEQERTSISNGCVQALQKAVTARAFSNIDVYVRTAFAGTTVAARPPMYQQTVPLSSSSSSTATGAKP
jgi:hypothetical protein